MPTALLYADRFIDLLSALEDFHVASTSAMGDTGEAMGRAQPVRVSYTSTMPDGQGYVLLEY